MEQTRQNIEASSNTESLAVAKSVAICVLFMASMILGTIPIKLSQWFNWKSSTKNNSFVSILLCIGAGVLICTTFLHLLPEVAENINDLEEVPDISLPLAELLMCLGFFIMYFVEECVHSYIHKQEKISGIRRSISISRGDSNLDQEYHHHIDHSHTDHSHMVMKNSTIITLRGLLVVLALSIHELFEGLAVGLEDSTSSVWYMFGAVSAHKLVIAFCIGVELVTSGMRTTLTVIYVFTFAVVSPIGIGIGMALTEGDSPVLKVMAVILQGLATGTLLYVVFFEILRADRKSGVKHYFSVLLGFLIMLTLTFIENKFGGHSHGHGDNDDEHDHDHDHFIGQLKL